MEHTEAIRLMAAEKYLLDELTPELREGFEEHFFGCKECAADVQAGSAFIEHAKTVLSTPGTPERSVTQPAPQRSPWEAWLRPAFVIPVLAALTVAFLYQNLVVVAKLRTTVAAITAPQVVPILTLTGSSRGGVNLPEITVPAGKPFDLSVDVHQNQYFSYVFELHSPDKKVQWSIPASAEAVRNGSQVHIPSAPGNSGDYELWVRGIVSGQTQISEPEIFSFRLKIEQ